MNIIDKDATKTEHLEEEKKYLCFICISCRKKFKFINSFKRHTIRDTRPNGCSNKDKISWALCKENATKQIEYYKKPKKLKKVGQKCYYSDSITNEDILLAKKDCNNTLKKIMLTINGGNICFDGWAYQMGGKITQEELDTIKLALEKYKKNGYELLSVKHVGSLKPKHRWDESGRYGTNAYRNYYYLIKNKNIYLFWRNHDGHMIKVGRIENLSRPADVIFEENTEQVTLVKYIISSKEINKEFYQRTTLASELASRPYYGCDSIFYSHTWIEGMEIVKTCRKPKYFARYEMNETPINEHYTNCYN
tara:strand:+ start:141 stop:1061 length:921 start_codon:yes stop_codon:yes gene_type:complete